MKDLINFRQRKVSAKILMVEHGEYPTKKEIIDLLTDYQVTLKELSMALELLDGYKRDKQ